MSANLNPDLFQLAMSKEAQPLMDLVKKFRVEQIGKNITSKILFWHTSLQ